MNLGSSQLLAGPQSASSAEEASGGNVLSLNNVRWDDDSFWGGRLKACREGTLPTMTQLMRGTERSHFLENFRIAAGLSEGRHRGPAWNDGDTYKWMEAISAVLAQHDDLTLRTVLDEAIDIVGKAQRGDGYIHTPVLIAQRAGDKDARPFADPVNFEMYNIGHLMTTASVHFEVTQDRRLLDIAIRAADFLDREFSNPNVELARQAICPAHYMGILDLYRITHEPRYLKLCQRWFAMRDLVQGGDDNQDRLPFQQQREIAGHAVRANYLYAGAADLYLEQKDPAMLGALESCWTSLQQKKIYITGGCGALFDGASPDGSDQQKTITRIHQAYGRNYQLPNSTAHNETCAAIGNVLWSYRMWRISNEARYIDALETSLYNAVLAGVSLDGQRFFYTNTLRQLDQMPTELRWSRERKEWISCYCCPPNVARTVASVGRYAYSPNDDSVSVLLYGSNRLKTMLTDDSVLELTQRASYPADGNISLVIKSAPERPYAINLRIPGWCEQATITVNGTPHEGKLQPASFAQVIRTWAADDRIELKLSMPPTLVTAHPLVEDCRGQVAVRRGPLVYCVESSDLPKDTSVLSVSLPVGTDWQPELGKGELAGIQILSGDVAIAADMARPKTSHLYEQYRRIETHRVTTNLVPYFAWGNRGHSEMSVWIPVQP